MTCTKINMLDYEEVAESVSPLKEARRYIEAAHDSAENRYNRYGDDYMSSDLYEVMQETNRLISRIDAIISAANVGFIDDNHQD